MRVGGVDFASLWRRCRFHLSGLVLLVPLALLPGFLSPRPEPGPEAFVSPAHDVGAWRVTVARTETGYVARVMGGDPHAIRAAYLAVGGATAPAPATPGVPLTGAPSRLMARIPVAAPLDKGAVLWLSVEDWTGTWFRTAWPLRPTGDPVR